MAKPTDDALKRLGGGRWQTRDERFTIEPQSGTWVVVVPVLGTSPETLWLSPEAGVRRDGQK